MSLRRLAGAIALSLTASVSASGQPIPGLTTTQGVIRAKAQPDECFSFIGGNQPYTKPPCVWSQPKVNQAYVWSIAQAGSDVWFGTAANPECMAQAGLRENPGELVSYRTSSWVCEFGASPYSPWLLPDIIGDFRPPQIFVWDKSAGVLIEMTPRAPATPDNPLGLDSTVSSTLGFRAATTIGNLVIVAGPSLLGGLNFFFFRADTRAYLGSGTLPGYDNIRQFAALGGQLYAAVGQMGVGGAVLRWTGSLTDPGCSSCLSFEVVGSLNGVGAFIVGHEGRLFVSVWPSLVNDSVAAIYMSPPVPEEGLTSAAAGDWTKVWDAHDYEPDPVIATSYAGGALASFDGYLYWGTMHVAFGATGAFVLKYGVPPTEQGIVEAVMGTVRAGVLFRGRNFNDGGREIDLLYGSTNLPVYRPPAGDRPGTWELARNNMPPGKQVPLYGGTGLNNLYNNYIWSMSVWNDRLWVGTMDWSHLADQLTRMFLKIFGQPVPPALSQVFRPQSFGADLFFFQDSATPAVAENSTGLGNGASYGVRSMLPSAGSLFLGMANPANLLTGPFGPRGGWELIELVPGGRPPLTLLTGFACAPLAEGSGTMTTCTATTSAPAPATGVFLTAAVSAILTPGVTPHVPFFVYLPPGATEVTFDVRIDGTPTASIVATLIARLNGGTRMAPLEVRAGKP